MAYALAIGGTGERLELTSPYVMVDGDIIEYVGEFKNSFQSFQMFLDFYSGSGSYVSFKDGGDTFYSRIANVTKNATVGLVDGDVFTYTLEKTPTQYIHTLNGVELFRHDSAPSITFLGFSDVKHYIKGQFRRCTITNGSLIADYNPDASDHSGSTDQPILTDTVGSNDATGVGFPSFDASVWVNLGGGGEELIIDSGSFTISGTTQPLRTSFNTVTESGSYALTGTASDLIYNGTIVNESGTYTLIGTDADLKSVFNVISESGQYDLTGTEVTLIYSPGSGEIITIDSGVFQLLGTEQSLKYNAKLIVNAGDYSLSGTQTQIKYNGNIPLDSGSYLYNGSNINLVADYGIITGIGNYSLFGSVVNLIYSGDTNQKIGVVTAGYKESGITLGYKESGISTNYKPNSITVNFKGS